MTMGFTEAELTLANCVDEELARMGRIKFDDVRALAVTALVDTGTRTLVIPPETKDELGLDVVEKRVCRFANGTKQEIEISSPVNIRYRDRTASCRAYIVPNAHILLGCIPLEEMRLKVNPDKRTLEVPPPEEDVISFMSVR